MTFPRNKLALTLCTGSFIYNDIYLIMHASKVLGQNYIDL